MQQTEDDLFQEKQKKMTTKRARATQDYCTSRINQKIISQEDAEIVQHLGSSKNYIDKMR